MLSLALEALSWVEMKKISYSSAVRRSAKQLRISNKEIIARANFIIRTVLHRKNFVDRVLDLALAPAALKDFNFGNQSFLRIFVFEAKFNSKSVDELT